MKSKNPYGKFGLKAKSPKLKAKVGVANTRRGKLDLPFKSVKRSGIPRAR